ncbi:MAG: response regulator transcription factor [Flavobacteriales bacterium]|nr:response regulator transcription factor [Flavobacteriales bacterium]
MKNIRVVIFEDNDNLRNSLELLINHTDGMECTGSFTDCTELQTKLSVSKPDVVLMDIDMPGINGIEAVSLIRKSHPEIQTIMQTVFDDDDRIFKAICAGAAGYLLKGTSGVRITSAITEVIEGGSPISPGVARRVLTLLGNSQQSRAESPIELTSRERQVLEELVNGKSYKMIADSLGISTPTVNTHIRKIYEKLQVNSIQQAVAMALKKGLV